MSYFSKIALESGVSLQIPPFSGFCEKRRGYLAKISLLSISSVKHFPALRAGRKKGGYIEGRGLSEMMPLIALGLFPEAVSRKKLF